MVSLLAATLLSLVGAGCVPPRPSYKYDPPVTASRPLVAPLTVPPATRTPRTSTTPTTFVTKKPVVVSRTEYYEVRGRTLAELSRVIDRNGLVDPADPKKTIGAGQTVWTISWKWASSPGPFDARSIAVTATTTVKLPRWTPPPGTDARIVGTWSRFVDALARHEGEHVALVRGYAEALPAFVEAQSPIDYPSGDREAEVMLARCTRDNTAFDVRTDHGATEGASRAGWN